MDVPSWHPANENSDAVRRLQALGGGAASQRTRFTVMAGSSADTSTEAGRQLVDRDGSETGGGRGLLDTSDRLYLLEQTRLEQEAKSREQQERDAVLQNFRSNALKVHMHKAAVPEIAVAAGSGKRFLTSSEKKTVVVIKAKKRHALGTEKKAKKAKKTETKSQTMPGSSAASGSGGENNAENARSSGKRAGNIETNGGGGKSTESDAKKSASMNPATALLLQDYSSSSDDE